MRNLVVFGDSWPAGMELETPMQHAFPYLIGKQLNFDTVINLSEGGTSLLHLLLQLKKWLSVKSLYSHDTEYVFLFCLTASVRSLWFNELGEPKEIIPTDKSKTSYYAEAFHWPETAKFNWYQTVTLLQGFSSRYAIKDYYVQMFECPPMDSDYNRLISMERMYACARNNMRDFLYSLENEPSPQLYKEAYGPELKVDSSAYRKYFAPNFGHPNILGHQLIANEIVNFMKSL